MKKNIIIIILLLFLLIFQISFLNDFDFFLLKFNCVIVALILMLNILSFNKVIGLALMCGFFMDIFSSMPFGTFLITYTLTIFITEVLFLNFLTNHSFYSIILLGIIAVVSFNFIFLAISGVSYFFNIGNFGISGKFWLDLLLQIIDHSIILGIAFYFINNRSRLFKPVFLRS